MRFSDIVKVITESSQQTDSLLTVLNYLQKRAKEDRSDGKVKMDALISQVKGSGADSFEYDNFVDAFEKSEAIKNLVADYNEDNITLKLNPISTAGGGEEQAADTVSQMAKSAVNI